jgi:hypothetical protein
LQNGVFDRLLLIFLFFGFALPGSTRSPASTESATGRYDEAE